VTLKGPAERADGILARDGAVGLEYSGAFSTDTAKALGASVHNFLDKGLQGDRDHRIIFRR
jgi:hypothetical protein